MPWEWVAAAVLVALVIGYIVGMGFGLGTERDSWLVRAERKDRPYVSRHYCDGDFYVVVEAKYFFSNYRRVPKRYPQEHEADGGR